TYLHRRTRRSFPLHGPCSRTLTMHLPCGVPGHSKVCSKFSTWSDWVLCRHSSVCVPARTLVPKRIHCGSHLGFLWSRFWCSCLHGARRRVGSKRVSARYPDPSPCGSKRRRFGTTTRPSARKLRRSTSDRRSA